MYAQRPIPNEVITQFSHSLRIYFTQHNMMAVAYNVAIWRGDNGVGRIDKVTSLRWARLVLIWVTVFSRANDLRIYNQPPRLTQPPTVSGTGTEYRPKWGDVLRLGGGL